MKLRDYEKAHPTWARIWRELGTKLPLDEMLVSWAVKRIGDGTEAYMGDSVAERIIAAHVEATEDEIARLERVLPESARYRRNGLNLLQARVERARIEGAAKAAKLAEYMAANGMDA